MYSLVLEVWVVISAIFHRYYSLIIHAKIVFDKISLNIVKNKIGCYFLENKKKVT